MPLQLNRHTGWPVQCGICKNYFLLEHKGHDYHEKEFPASVPSCYRYYAVVWHCDICAKTQETYLNDKAPVVIYTPCK